MANEPLVYINAKVVAETSAAIAEATGSALQKNADAFTRGLFRALKKEAIPEHRMFHANQVVAERAQAAIVNGWLTRLRVPKTPSSFRAEDRLTGKLGATLASGAMTERTSARAISFLNADVLSRGARHWYRVNYGANGPRKSPDRPRPHAITLDGHTIATLQDPGRPARNSWLPRRFITDGETRLQPVRMKGPLPNIADVPGGGHRAALFSELGFRALAANLGPEYELMLEDWVREEGAEAVRRALHAQGVRIPANILARG